MSTCFLKQGHNVIYFMMACGNDFYPLQEYCIDFEEKEALLSRANELINLLRIPK